MASTIMSLLPQTPGLLPQWLLLTSLISVGNSVQAYTTLKFTSRVYNPSPIDPPPITPKHVTALSSRTFGTWTFLAAIIRLYAAYNITNAAVYQLAIWVYFVAFAHFSSEWMVFKTARWGLPIAGPMIISSGSLVWLFMQWSAYVE